MSYDPNMQGAFSDTSYQPNVNPMQAQLAEVLQGVGQPVPSPYGPMGMGAAPPPMMPPPSYGTLPQVPGLSIPSLPQGGRVAPLPPAQAAPFLPGGEGSAGLGTPQPGMLPSRGVPAAAQMMDMTAAMHPDHMEAQAYQLLSTAQAIRAGNAAGVPQYSAPASFTQGQPRGGGYVPPSGSHSNVAPAAPTRPQTSPAGSKPAAPSSPKKPAAVPKNAQQSGRKPPSYNGPSAWAPGSPYYGNPNMDQYGPPSPAPQQRMQYGTPPVESRNRGRLQDERGAMLEPALQAGEAAGAAVLPWLLRGIVPRGQPNRGGLKLPGGQAPSRGGLRVPASAPQRINPPAPMPFTRGGLNLPPWPPTQFGTP